MSEIWSNIEGFEDRYQISNLGNIKNIKKNRLRAITTHKSGYCVVYLKKQGKIFCLYVHRLVGKAFVANPDNKPHINHKDGIKSNNRADNLEWCTIRENAIHAFEMGLRKPTEKQRQATILFNKTRKRYPKITL